MRRALRLHSVQPSSSCDAVEDTVLPRGGGDDGKSTIFVRPGTMVQYGIIALQRQRDLWVHEADEFCPGRWKTEMDSWLGYRGRDFIPLVGEPESVLDTSKNSRTRL